MIGRERIDSEINRIETGVGTITIIIITETKTTDGHFKEKVISLEESEKR